jgi:hypothetical protein
MSCKPITLITASKLIATRPHSRLQISRVIVRDLVGGAMIDEAYPNVPADTPIALGCLVPAFAGAD